MKAESNRSETSSGKHPRQALFSEVLDCWDRWDDHGRDANARAALCLEDRYYLLINVLGRKDAWHPWVYDRCREVEKDPDGFLDIWARGHYKSTIITFAGVLQEILRNREITVGIFSHTPGVAKAFLAQIKREAEANTDLRALFPNVFYDNPGRDSPSWSLDHGIILKRSSNPKEATVEAHGLVDGQPTSKHYGLMVFDDVVVEGSVATPEQIEKTTAAWSLADNLGSRQARKWHVGTRYHFADTYSVILERGAATERIYPATDDGTLTGNPVFLSVAEWNSKKRDQLESTVACQLLANPQAGSQRMFDPNDLPMYEVRPQTLMVYLLCDPAHSLKKSSDDSAFIVVGIDTGWNKYLLDSVAHKMTLADKWRWLRDL